MKTYAKIKSGFLPILMAIRANFGDAHQEMVWSLIPLAPNAGRHTQRLPASAYRKGLVAGLSADSISGSDSANPYAKSMPNFAKGANDPKPAWRQGAADGERIRKIALRPTLAVYPTLLHSEYKALASDIRAIVDRGGVSISGKFVLRGARDGATYAKAGA
jgi:hypothetical protein